MPTKIQCGGCRRLFTAHSHTLHLSQTQNPRCRALFAAMDGYLPGADESDSDSDTEGGGHGGADSGDDRDLPTQIFEGDMFGQEYTDADFPGLWSDTEEAADGRLGESDSEADDELEEEAGWEPPAAHGTGTPPHQLRVEDMEEYGRLLTPQERQNAEHNLRAQHFVDHFPSARAGEVVHNWVQAGYGEYSEELQTEDDNPYYPFSSKRDWEVAKWAKLRGPSSTAMTELLGIEGVCNIVFSHALSNKLPIGARNPGTIL